MRLDPRSILITGASSGIGRALALAYAAPGIHLALIGRDAARLEATANAAREKGASVETGAIDVRDRAAMATWIGGADARAPIDLAIANAGITTGLGPGEIAEEPEAVRAIIATNLIGVLNTAEPLIGPMVAHGGHLAFVGSIAGLHGLPYSPAYCLTKSAVHAWAESIRPRLEAKGVIVSLIVAGFVKTPLNDSITAAKPGELTDTQAAALIKRRLAKGHATIAFPWWLYASAVLGRFLPARVYGLIMRGIRASVPHTRERAEDRHSGTA